jgi:hypothetical protein
MTTHEYKGSDLSACAGELHLNLEPPKPNYQIHFHKDHKVIGTLDFNGDKMVFIGEAEPSAKIFLDFLASSFKDRLCKEFNDGYEYCVREAKAMEEDEDNTCTHCAGTGEGMYDGASCRTCQGRGYLVKLREDD